MPPRPPFVALSLRRFIAPCLLILLTASTASPQTLNLDAGKPPEANTGRAVLAEIERLEQQIDILDRMLDTNPSVLASRRLARDLLTSGERLADAGSIHIITGFHLVEAFPDIDDLAARSNDDVALNLAIDRFTSQAESFVVPASPERLTNALRALLALLAEERRDADTRDGRTWTSRQNTVGWTGPLLDNDRTASRWRTWVDTVGPQLTPDATVAIGEIDDLVQTGDAWLVYRRTARDLALTLMEAWTAPELLDADWLPPSLDDELRGAFSAATLDFADPATRDDGRNTLLALTTIRTLIEGAHASDLTGIKRIGPSLQNSLARLIRKLLDDPRHARTRGKPAIRLFSLFARYDAHDERTVAQSLRPAFRALDDNAGQTQDALLTVLEPALFTDDAATNPELIASVNAFARSIEDLDAIVTIHRWLDMQTIYDDRRRRLADARILDLSKQTARNNDDARNTLTGFGAVLNAIVDHTLAATEPDALIDRVTGNRRTQLDQRVNELTTRWARAWAVEGSKLQSDDDAAALADELQLLLRLVIAINDGVAILEIDAAANADPTDRTGLAASPAAHLPPEVTTVLARAARNDLPRLTRALLDGQQTAARAAMRDHERTHPTRAVIAALQRRTRATTTGGAPLAQLAEPPTPRADLAPHHADIAAICRYLREYTHAITNGDTDRAAGLRTYLNIRARDLEPHLETQSPAGA